MSWLSSPATFGLVPQLGSPFAMKYGGVELSRFSEGFANALDSAAKIAEAISASAGIEAGFLRRDEDWKHQQKLAQHEIDGLDAGPGDCLGTAPRITDRRKNILIRRVHVPFSSGVQPIAAAMGSAMIFTAGATPYFLVAVTVFGAVQLAALAARAFRDFGSEVVSPPGPQNASDDRACHPSGRAVSALLAPS